MSESGLPFLKGRIVRTERYVSTRRGGHPPTIPSRDAAAHHALLTAQIDAIWKAVAKRGQDDRDPAASHEIIAIQPEAGSQLPPDSYGDKRYGMRVISEDATTGIVLVDASRPDLPNMRQKLESYADESKKSTETGERRSAPALNPIRELRIAEIDDLRGPRLRRAVESGDLKNDVVTWFELGCRGGRRARTLETDRSRQQIGRVLGKLGRSAAVEFLAPEQVLLFVRITLDELRIIVRAVDCVYEIDLVAAEMRDWLLLTQPGLPSPDFLNFKLIPPPANAVSVVVLDTGVASSHPALATAILHHHTIVPGDTSAEDGHGHGTMMAGVALHDDLGSAIESNGAVATHWIESVKLVAAPHQGTAQEENRDLWPVLTQLAIESVEATGLRGRVFALAVTAALDDHSAATSWSHAIDQFGYNDGAGRLICVALGNCERMLEPLFADGYPKMNLTQTLDDPAHALNALSIGAYTTKTMLPPEYEKSTVRALAPEGGVSPTTKAGILGSPIKPDVVFEGGNLIYDGGRAYGSEITLATLTTSRDVLTSPLAVHQATSAATAQAARFTAQVWQSSPDLRPETIRALVVHAARWTPQMLVQLPNIDERLALCGYGVPNFSYATECLASRATVIVEDEMPNSALLTEDDGKERRSRLVKHILLPIPDSLVATPDEEVELAVTLSFFGEPSTFRRRERMGLRVSWDMQGPAESEDEFRQRINMAMRPKGEAAGEYEKTKGFSEWNIGPQRRGRGTVQSDRLRVAASMLAGQKLIAVYPVLGWWDDRDDTQEEVLRFSLVVTLEVPSGDIYTPIATAVASLVEVETR